MRGEGGGGGGGMQQQLSVRDCDKWLSMTLTMKERLSSAWTGGREGDGKREKQLEGSVAPCAIQGVLA